MSIEQAPVTDNDNRCDECGEVIPPTTGGGLANKWHLSGCSLYDPNEY